MIATGEKGAKKSVGKHWRRGVAKMMVELVKRQCAGRRTWPDGQQSECLWWCFESRKPEWKARRRSRYSSRSIFRRRHRRVTSRALHQHLQVLPYSSPNRYYPRLEIPSQHTLAISLRMSNSVKLYVYDLSNGLARQLSQQLTGRQIDGIW